MHRRSLTSSLARAALAYLVALQALLGAWAGHAMAAGPNAFDPLLTLCRTAAAGETQQSDRDAVVPAHCAVMCLSGACADGSAPAVIGTAMAFLPLQGGSIALTTADVIGGAALLSGAYARGPPSIA